MAPETINSFYTGTPIKVNGIFGDNGRFVALLSFSDRSISFYLEDLVSVVHGFLGREDPTPEFTITRGPYGDIFVDGHGTYDGEITIEEAEKEIPVSKAILEFLKSEQKEKNKEEESGVEDLAYALVRPGERNPVTVAYQMKEARRLYALGVRAPKRES